MFDLNLTDVNDFRHYVGARRQHPTERGFKAPHNTDQTPVGTTSQGVQVHGSPKSKEIGVTNDDNTRRVIHFAPVRQPTPQVSIVQHELYETLATYGHSVQVHVSPKLMGEAIEGRNRQVELPKRIQTTPHVSTTPHNSDQALAGEDGHGNNKKNKDSDMPDGEVVGLPQVSQTTPHVVIKTYETLVSVHSQGADVPTGIRQDLPFLPEVPQSTEPSLMSTYSTPKSTHSTPKSSHNTPKSTHNTPRSTHSTPKSTHSTAKSTYSTPKTMDPGVPNDGITRRVIQFAPVTETTPQISIIPHNPDETLASESRHKVKVSSEPKDSDPPNEGSSGKVTTLVEGGKSTPQVLLTTTSRVETPANMHSHVDEVHVTPKNEGNIRDAERFAPVSETTPLVSIITSDPDKNLASHGIKVLANPKSKDTATPKEESIQKVIILPQDSQTRPTIVAHNPDQTLAIEHGRPDPKYKVIEMPDVGSGMPFLRGGERESMPVGRRDGVDSEMGCKLNFTSTAWIVCMIAG